MSQVSDPILEGFRQIRGESAPVADSPAPDPILDGFRRLRPAAPPRNYGFNAVGVPGTVSTPDGVIPMPPSRTDPRVQQAMDQQQAMGEAQAAKAGGIGGAIATTYANTGRAVLNEAGNAWQDLATGRRSLPEVMLGEDPRQGQPGVVDAAVGRSSPSSRFGGPLTEGDVQGIQSQAAATAQEYPKTAGATDLATGLTLGNADPRNLAAMVASGLPAGATMESAPVQRALGMIESKYGPRVSGAVEGILHGQVAGAAFGGTRGAMDPNATPMDVLKQAGGGAALGTIAGAGGETIGAVADQRAINRGNATLIDQRLNGTPTATAQDIADNARRVTTQRRLNDIPAQGDAVEAASRGAAMDARLNQPGQAEDLAARAAGPVPPQPLPGEQMRAKMRADAGLPPEPVTTDADVVMARARLQEQLDQQNAQPKQVLTDRMPTPEEMTAAGTNDLAALLNKQPTTPPAPRDYKPLKLKALAAELESRGLPSEGSRKAMIDRLTADDAGKWKAQREPTPVPAPDKPADLSWMTPRSEPVAQPQEPTRAQAKGIETQKGSQEEGAQGQAGGGVRVRNDAQNGVEAGGADGVRDQALKDPVRMKIAELRAELEAGGVDVGKESRKSMVEGVKALREMQGEPPADAKKSVGHEPGNVYGTPKDAMGAASASELYDSPAGQMTEPRTSKARQVVNMLMGKTLPKMLAASEDAANATARHASAQIAAPMMARDVAAKVLGDHYKDSAFTRKFGALLVEEQLRAARQSFLDAGEKDAADAVRTVVGSKDSPFKTEADFQAALKDPEITAAIDRHKTTIQADAQAWQERLGGKMRAAGPNTGAFINTEAVGEHTQEKPVGGGGGKGNILNPIRKGTVHGKAFSGTSTTYEFDYAKQVEKMLGNYNEITKRDMYDALKRSGLGIELEVGKKPPLINGEHPKVLPIERRAKDGKTYTANLWLRPDIYGEVRNALNVDLDVGQKPWMRAVTAAQLAAPTDAVFHAANWLMSMAGQPRGRAVIEDMARAIPGVNVMEATTKIIGKMHEVAADSPEVRAAVADVFKIGAGRQVRETATEGIGATVEKYNPLHYLGKAVHAGDVAARLVMRDIYRAAVENGLTTHSEAAERDWINQIGQYNPRLMGKIERGARASGLSPFIVAGQNFNRVALRRVLQLPAFEAASPEARAKMLGTAVTSTALTFAIPAMWNFARTGQAFPPSVPVGAIYGGKDKDGHTWSVDPLKWTGLRRGMRMFGLGAGIEAARQGKSATGIAGAAGKESLLTNLHPWTGPAVDALSTLVTGSDASGHRSAEYAKKGQDQFLLNVKAAAFKTNPLLDALFSKKAKDTSRANAMWDYLKNLGRAFGVSEQTPPKTRGGR